MCSGLSDELRTKLNEGEKEFNEYRDQLINEAISSGNDPLKLKRLQWRIDGVILKSTKLGAVVKLSSMMTDSFLELQDTLNFYSGLNRHK